MLKLIDLCVSYGGIRALSGVSFEVPKGAIVSLLGANGAGKSTTVRAVSGIVPIASGDVLFEGVSIKYYPAHRIQRLGLVQVPEGRKIFSNLTVGENLVMGAYHQGAKKQVKDMMDRVCAKFEILGARFNQLGGTLSGGEQQMLAIGRALMSEPKLLMMDEPSLGLAPMVSAEVFRIITEIRSEGVTVLLIEQNANSSLKISDYAVLLETGKVVLKGRAKDMLENPALKRAYLGETSFSDIL